ncbi:expressed unknown protein [Seminavis robusta]|uniref:G-protein coupled receptors family 1 profile domain-containing protein n=1 Tax=Seminavis robusta TaxID=568900 RepID=A0A9N8EWT6_9STRA|nr:expressed unknown protein [Seminavis robusta]|eukprot:Sro1787_g297510.1 n/a (400) ;mRNA; f:9839-11102
MATSNGTSNTIGSSQRVPDDPLHQWEIDESHDRFQWKLAWPGDRNLYLQFALLATINAVVAVACLILILSLLRYRKVRRNPFNLYILFTAIPDFMTSFLCFFTCSLSAAKGRYYSEWMCSFQAFYLTFGFTANCWMNAVIAYEVYRLLRLSSRRERYLPPTRTQVYRQVAVVYIYATFWSLLGVWKIPFLPHDTLLLYGIACFPHEYDQASTIFYWVLFIPAFMGRRRELALFFGRVIVIYFGMWLPFLFICTLGNFVNLSEWWFWAGAAWSHIQGLVSAIVAATRPQIWGAIVDCFRCVPEENRVESWFASMLAQSFRGGRFIQGSTPVVSLGGIDNVSLPLGSTSLQDVVQGNGDGGDEPDDEVLSLMREQEEELADGGGDGDTKPRELSSTQTEGD